MGLMINFGLSNPNCVVNNQNFSLQKLLRLGIREDTSFIETQKTYMFNLFLVIASPFAVISLVINFIEQAWLPALFNVVQLCVFALCFRISKMQKGLHLRPLLLLILSIVAIIAAYFYKNGSEYRLLVMMIAAVVIFDKSWQFLLFAAMVSIAFVWIRLDDQTLADDPHEGLVGGILKMLLPCSCLRCRCFISNTFISVTSHSWKKPMKIFHWPNSKRKNTQYCCTRFTKPHQ
jgi:hypothetical protein